MFGKNKILKIVHEDNGVLDVHSVFYTIQGEGPHAGRAAVFVRLHGCSLACSWCDTEFESVCKQRLPTALLDEVVGTYMLKSTRKPLIVISGGEPMRQNLAPFITLATSYNFQVQIETAGIHWQDELRPLFNTGLTVVVSPKTPVVQPGFDDARVSFKYIIDAHEPYDEEDGLPLHGVSQRGQPGAGRLYRPPSMRSVYVQPLDPPGNTIDQERWAHRMENVARCVQLVQRYGYRLSLQQHKIIGVD